MNDLVALARSLFQTFTIQNRDAAARVLDQVSRLQRSTGYGHTTAARAQHVCYELMSQLQLIPLHPIMDHQQPTTQTLFDAMQPIAQSTL